MARVEATITQSLSHCSAHITRVEVHLSDGFHLAALRRASSARSKARTSADGAGERRDKKGQTDKRCMIEARLRGNLRGGDPDPGRRWCGGQVEELDREHAGTAARASLAEDVRVATRHLALRGQAPDADAQ